MARIFLLVMDSVGLGGAPDAQAYGDDGANTLGSIAAHFARQGQPLHLPFMDGLGLGLAAELACGTKPAGLGAALPRGLYGAATETSKGKDTPSGHWELAGVPVTFDWGYFPHEVPAFPASLMEALIHEANLPGTLANCHASGMPVIQEHGEEHMRTGRPIVYTSADSVLQIAAHEETFGLKRLYKVCAIARALTRPLTIGRVIARPFIGKDPKTFIRTPNRKDYAIEPPGNTLFDIAAKAGREVISVGKIGDIFAHRNTGTALKAKDDMGLFDAMLGAAKTLRDGGFVMANFVEFDTLYGHQRDIQGYGAHLMRFDARLPELERLLKPGDLVLITADHGNDPGFRGTDHTRERVPVLGFGPGIKARSLGVRDSFADVGATAAAHLGLPPPAFGKAF